MPVKIVTDSASDITPEEAKKLGIRIVPLHVNMGGKSYYDDGEALPEGFFYNALPNFDKVTTAMPNKEEILAVWRKIPDSEIVMITISSKLSGTFAQAKEAARECPNAKVIDSLNVSAGLRFLVLEALEMANAGENADSIVKEIEKLKPKIRLYGVFDTLEYLKRGGRIGKAECFFGSLVGAKPIISFRDGELQPAIRERTKQRAVAKMLERFYAEGEMTKIAVIHAGVEGEANEFRAALMEKFPGMKIPIVQLGPTLGTYSGPGLVGVCGLLK